jgi:xylulokinase
MINSHHVGADRFLSLGGTLCGAVLEWTRKMLGGAAHEVLEREAKRAGDLIMLPYLQGERTPIWDASARGVFFGLSLAHERGHLYRAAMEAIAVSFLHIAEVSGIALREVIAANGAGKSALFRQILADALGAPLTYVASGGTVGGAAILAGMGIGVQLRGMTSDPVVHSPDEAEHDRYVRMLSRRMDLYERVRSLHLHEGSSV